jgi:hypothetical protein
VRRFIRTLTEVILGTGRPLIMFQCVTCRVNSQLVKRVMNHAATLGALDRLFIPLLPACGSRIGEEGTTTEDTELTTTEYSRLDFIPFFGVML